jgi:flagellar biosynthesis/type III secretory pathway M-ring protein FliF/YscJ
MEYLPIAYKPLTSLILAVLFIFFVVRPLLKRMSFSIKEPMAPTELAPVPAISSETAPEPKQLDLRTQTVKLVKGDAERAAGVVKAWLNEKGER